MKTKGIDNCCIDPDFDWADDDILLSTLHHELHPDGWVNHEIEPAPGKRKPLLGELVESTLQMTDEEFEQAQRLYWVPKRPTDDPILPLDIRLKEALIALDLNKPIKRSMARVWRDKVLVSEVDIAECTIRWGKPLWQGRGFVLYQKRIKYDDDIPS